MDFLEYPDITAEVKGAMMPGRLKMTDQALIFKNQKTGKVEQISASEMEMVNFQKFVGTWGLRIFLKNGTLHRFRGFKDGEREKIAKFFHSNYKKDMLEKELSMKGWNWGTAKFHGSVLSFDVGHHTAFEIPLNNVSQCTTGKNEVTLEFHQNDDAPVSLLEMRFHIPVSDNSEKDPVELFHKEVMDKASVINVSGESVALFREIQCLTPRGRYDITIFQTFFQLHGKTFDYKIPMSTVLRLFLLPHKDNRQMFFVVSLDPPIKQGQTRYHYLVLLFNQDDEVTIELPYSEEELKERYEDKLTKEMTGPTYEIMGKVMKVIINRKLIGPGSFQGTSNTPAIGCSYKAAAGYLYPLERGFMYVHKPPIHIRFDEISSVNFARSGGSTRSFDFEIELTTGTVHTFSSIEKGEYDKLFDYINAKKLRVKNRGKGEKSSYNDDFGGSDDEAEPDAYLARVKAEAKERDEGDDDDDDESTDEDFKPAAEESDVAEEYDSNPNDTSDSDADSDASGGSGKKDKEKKKKEKKPKSAKTVSEKPRKPRKQKKEKDENKPKRPPSGYMLYLNSVREEIKSKNPGIKVTEIAQKGGEMWKELKDRTKWEEKANKLKEEWQEAMKEYKASGGSSTKEPKEKSKSEKKPASKKKEVAKESPSKIQSGSFKSKEYISDDDSSSDDESSKKKSRKRKASSSDESDKSGKEEKASKPTKKQKKKSESEASDVESEEEASSGGSDSD